jgi:hypothetical protein
LTFGLAYTSEEGTGDRGLIQLVVYYLISLGSQLHSDMFNGIVWLIIMVKVYHYRCSPIFPFYGIDESRLQLNHFY